MDTHRDMPRGPIFLHADNVMTVYTCTYYSYKDTNTRTYKCTHQNIEKTRHAGCDEHTHMVKPLVHANDSYFREHA